MDDWISWFKSLPWKDWGPSLITGGSAVFVGLIAWFSKDRSDRRVRRDLQRKDQREREEKDQKIEHDQDIAAAAEFTNRFKALMSGYEARIADLNQEVVGLRGDVRDVRQQLESHQRICRGCPNFDERFRARST